MNGLRLAGVLAIVAGGLVLAQQVALAVHDIGVFELEGDAVNDPAVLGDDWDTVNLGGGGGSIARTGVLADAGNATIFTGGGSKDIIDISSWAGRTTRAGCRTRTTSPTRTRPPTTTTASC